jgi:hypothetical protein
MERMLQRTRERETQEPNVETYSLGSRKVQIRTCGSLARRRLSKPVQ